MEKGNPSNHLSRVYAGALIHRASTWLACAVGGASFRRIYGRAYTDTVIDMLSEKGWSVVRLGDDERPVELWGSKP